MDSKLFYINFGINGIYYIKAFVNSGCLCFTFISQSFARRLRLLRILITLRNLKQVNTTKRGVITYVTYVDTDINGYKRKKIFFYVIPG